MGFYVFRLFNVTETFNEYSSPIYVYVLLVGLISGNAAFVPRNLDIYEPWHQSYESVKVLLI